MSGIQKVAPYKARKRLRNPDSWKRCKKKQKLYSTNSLPTKLNCNQTSKTYKCGSLTSRDMFWFHKSFYEKPTKIYQNNFILKYSISTKIKRRRPTKRTRNTKEISTRYFVRKHPDHSLVPVCLKCFLGILRLKKGRVQRVLKRHMRSGEMAKESRGGDRKTFTFASRKEAIEKFIQCFTPIETHYCRGKNHHRIYLSPDLSIKRMHYIIVHLLERDNNLPQGVFEDCHGHEMEEVVDFV